MKCDLDLSSIKLEVISASDCCKHYKAGDVFSLGELIPKNECLLALQEVFPYRLTFDKGGYFKWEDDKDSVVTQCPNTQKAVAIRVFRSKEDPPKVVGIRSLCPKGYDNGKEILGSIINDKRICLAAFDNMTGHIMFLEKCSREGEKSEPIVVQCTGCPGCEASTKFRLSLK